MDPLKLMQALTGKNFAYWFAYVCGSLTAVTLVLSTTRAVLAKAFPEWARWVRAKAPWWITLLNGIESLGASVLQLAASKHVEPAVPTPVLVESKPGESGK